MLLSLLPEYGSIDVCVETKKKEKRKNRITFHYQKNM